MSDFEKLLGKLGKGEITVETQMEDLPPYPKPSKVRVNNMTIIISIGSPVNVTNFYDNIKLPSNGDKKANKTKGIISIKAGKGEEKGLVNVPIYKSRKKEAEDKKIGSKKAQKKTGAFRNQVHVNIRPPWYTDDELKNKNRKKEKGFNVKIFKNGTLQMTGPRSVEDAKKAAEIVIKKLKKTKGAVEDHSLLKVGSYSISMINASFAVNFEVDRGKVCKLLKKEYKMWCDPHKPNYQGVNLKFFYNDSFDKNNGICHCKCLSEKKIKKMERKGNTVTCAGIGKCDGFCTKCSCPVKYKKKIKGSGKVVNSCRCISIFIFGSGEHLITGGTSFEQVECVYKFMNKFYKKNYEMICIPSESGTYIKRDGVVSKSIVKSNVKKHKESEKCKEKVKIVKILLI